MKMAPESVYPLSPMQQGMMFHSLYAPQSGVNIQQIIGHLSESLDAPAFRRAWEKVVQRHSVFRTCFRWEGLKNPVQEVRPDVELPFAEHDWGRLSFQEFE